MGFQKGELSCFFSRRFLFLNVYLTMFVGVRGKISKIFGRLKFGRQKKFPTSELSLHQRVQKQGMIYQINKTTEGTDSDHRLVQHVTERVALDLQTGLPLNKSE